MCRIKTCIRSAENIVAVTKNVEENLSLPITTEFYDNELNQLYFQ